MGLREVMPKVAAMVDARREQYGKTFVDGCIRAGIAGVPDQFYAAEAGQQVGAPFNDPVMRAVAEAGAMNGVPVLLIRTPPQPPECMGEVVPVIQPSRLPDTTKSR